MNIITFPVGSTNIFPIVNSRAGGQLATEWNLRAREMVATSSSIDYNVGPSFVHSEKDFEIRIYQDSTGTILSPNTLEIMPGRGVFNGHYVELMTPMLVDMLEINKDLKSQSRAPLKGELCVGIRMFYSTEPTMAGSLLIENKNNMYEGVQIVIVPKEDMITPEDSPNDRSKITAHIKLGTFTFLNNTITAIISETESKLRYIPAERVKNADKLMTGNYVTKTGLNPKKIYTFSGKGTDPATGYDTWCDSTDSLMIWDKIPQRTTIQPAIDEAMFGISPTGNVTLYMPHKQVDGMTDASGNPEYYQPKAISLPIANYSSNSSGTVSKEYTKHIKDIANKIEDFYHMVKGKQVGFIEFKEADTKLPPINKDWEIGDYVLVSQDYTADEATDSVRPPVTIYVVLPGQIQSIKFFRKVENSQEIPEELDGIEISRIYLSEENRDQKPSESDDPTTYPEFYAEDDVIRGVPNADYFVAQYTNEDNSYELYYYVVETAGPRGWSNYLPVTGPVPFAQEDTVGGFYNVNPEDAVDAGYVYRDDYGRLRLVDYALLRSGTLAYQLGEDYTSPSGITSTEVQGYLDEYVNRRIAFPFHATSADAISVINVTIELPAEEEATTINISEIDSRFNTAVYLHITGEANSNTTINIYDCQKIRIDANIEGTPVINVYRSNIYYDPEVFNYVRSSDPTQSELSGFQDMKLWYEKWTDEDPDLLVDNMTVSELDSAIVANEVDYWSTSVLNDNHYMYALHSITFGPTGDIEECSILISDQSTNNIITGHKIVTGEFELPQGSQLTYPISCLTKQLKITGTFVSAYTSDGKWIVTDTNFSAVTGTYNEYDMNTVMTGSIAFHSITNILEAQVNSIPAWEPDSFHLFYGGRLN